MSKIIAVTGNSGSGKTTLSTKIAVELAEMKKNTAVIFCDVNTPVIPYISSNTEHNKSLGELLTLPALKQKDILDSAVTINENEYICLYGYKTGETANMFPKITKEKAVDFLVMLRHLVDYVIVDCSSYFEIDTASCAGIETADNVIKIFTANPKGLSFFYSHKNYFDENLYSKNSLNVLGNYKIGQEYDIISQQYEGVKHMIPYIPEIEQQFDEARIFKNIYNEETKKYIDIVKSLTNDLFFKEDFLNNESKDIKKVNAETTKKKINLNFHFLKNNKKGEF